ncbi:MAG: hypothetical protein R3B40_21530 [Polyangiales bacterium]
MISDIRRTRPALAFLLALVCGPLGLPSCAEDFAGIEVPVAYSGLSPLAAPVETADQVLVQLTGARVAIHALELQPCAEPVTSPLARAAQSLFLGAAHAHSSSSAMRIGVPVVVDALRDDALRPGVFRPVPGTYCGLHGMLAMPDDDALGASPSAPLEGAAELLGERLDDQGQVVSSFRLVSTMAVSFELMFDQPLVLSAQQPYAELALVLDPATWAGAITLPVGALDAEGAAALSRAAASALRVELSLARP